MRQTKLRLYAYWSDKTCKCGQPKRRGHWDCAACRERRGPEFEVLAEACDRHTDAVVAYLATLPEGNVTEREQQTKAILEQLATRRGHDLCHYEPEAIKQLMQLYGVEPPSDLDLPPREAFRQGCKNYEASLYDPEQSTTPAITAR